MPAAYLMSWHPKTRRWEKMYRGTRLTVSCRQLAKWSGRHVPDTKDGSYQVANEWIKAKIAELDAAPTPLDEELNEIRRRRDWCRARGMHDEVKRYDRLLTTTKKTGVAVLSAFERGSAYWTLFKAGLPVEDPADVPDQLVESVSGRSIWRERLEQGGGSPEAITIQAAHDRYLKLKQLKAQRGDLSPRTARTLATALSHFLKIVGPDTPAESISETTWATFYGEVAAAAHEPGYASRILKSARSFIEWMHAERLCESPRNLQSRDYRISVPTKAVETIDPLLLQFLLDNAQGQLPVHILLFANCGMTQADTSALRHDEVNWEAGRIRRKRTKEADEINVPEVDYKLWPQTLAALRANRSDDPERVLLTASGGPWVAPHSDRFSSSWGRFQRRMRGQGVEIPASKLIRKTSATLLESHEHFGRYYRYFLGHAPDSIADKHYVVPSREQFDKAVDWLRTQYFPAG